MTRSARCRERGRCLLNDSDYREFEGARSTGGRVGRTLGPGGACGLGQETTRTRSQKGMGSRGRCTQGALVAAAPPCPPRGGAQAQRAGGRVAAAGPLESTALRECVGVAAPPSVLADGSSDTRVSLECCRTPTRGHAGEGGSEALQRSGHRTRWKCHFK